MHGGINGLHQKYWELESQTESSLALTCQSEDGESGFPGNVKFTLHYQIAAESVVIDMFAETDQATPINMTGHAYFNLNVERHSSIKNHQLNVLSNKVLVTGQDSIPTGEIKSVKGTDFDFEKFRVLNELDISEEKMIQQQKGIDHNFIVANNCASSNLNSVLGNGSGVVEVAKLYSPESNLQLTVLSNMPGLQVYTGNFLDSPFLKHQGICLEPQYFPDSPNNPDFPNSILKPSDRYHHQIKYHFQSNQ